MPHFKVATPPRTADVVIVGSGPVGKLLAIQLGRQGHNVVVADRQLAAYPLPRAVTHCSDFARILQSVGLAPSTIPHITQPYDDMYVWRNGEGQTLVEVDWSGAGESGWFNTYFFHQPTLEEALDDVLAALPSVHVMRGWEAVELAQDETAATVTLRCNETPDTPETPESLKAFQNTGDADPGGRGERRSVQASWVVGADGANSKVRQMLGIDWHDEGYFHDWLVVDVKPDPQMAFPHVATQNCDTRRPSTMVPGGPGRRRWEFMRLPHEDKETLGHVDTAWRLLKPYGLTPQNAELERHSVYTFQAGWAQQWKQGRVFLAGDAAHLMPPFAGQGLGAGVRDVMNLGWKLDAALRHAADPALLETYGPERLQHAIAFVQFSVELGKVICISDQTQARERDARMILQWAAGMKPPAPPRPGLGPGVHIGPIGGHLARQGRVRLGDTPPALFDDVFHGPGALIARHREHLQVLPASVTSSLRSLNITPVAFRGNGDDVGSFKAGLEGRLDSDHSDAGTIEVAVVADVDGVYTRWLDELDADVVLVRPDFHLYGAGRGDDALELAVAFLTHVGSPEVLDLRPAPVPASC